MNAVALAEPVVANGRREMPWKPMARITWLQHRFMMLGVLGLCGCLAAYILYNERSIHSVYSQYVAHACQTPNSSNVVACSGLYGSIQHSTTTTTVINIALHVLPVVLGMFVGAPLVAREFESGTFRFTWTQGLPRRLWFALKFTFISAFLIVVTCVVGLLASSYNGPFNAVGLTSHWQSGEFDVTSLTLAAWTLFGFAIGTFAGALIKRTVAGMAVTGVLTGTLLFATFWKLNYVLFSFGAKAIKSFPSGSGLGALNTPSSGTAFDSGRFGAEVLPAPANGWLVNGWYTGSKGQLLTSKQVGTLVNKMFSSSLSKTPAQWLAQHHDAYWMSYQPANRFWYFQSVEAAILIGLALVLAWGASILIRRRA